MGTQKKKIKKLGKKKEITIEDLDGTVGDLSATVKGLVVTVGDLSATVKGLVVTVGDLSDSIKKNTNDIEELARMTQRGFENTVTKADIARLDARLDRIENLPLRAHENRIEILEDKMRQVQTTLGK